MKLILKGILLYTTFITIILFIFSIHNLFENNLFHYFMLFLVLVIAEVTCTSLWLSPDDYNTLTLAKWFEKKEDEYLDYFDK